MCKEGAALSRAEVEGIMSDVQARGSGRLRRAACGRFGPGGS